ncbi:MAG TPA: putative O-glycosylation ligase, exosortase A system-associated [Thermoanaerobaculia bacterium]|nr:putative O-glycosylation ligase, exosortase A system-associated [Thermoanaerobaculia bacterium]
MRDLAIVGIVCASLPLIVYRPFFGLLVYGWLAYMRPQDMAWGLTQELPLSQWVAVALVLGLVLALGRERWLVMRLQTVLLILLVGWISLSTVMAVLPDVAGTMYGYYWKAILISILTTGLVADRRRFRILLILITFSIGVLGAKRGLVGLMVGGIRYYDGPGGFMSDNNSFALVLNMVIPLQVGIAMVEKEKWLRVTALVMASLCAITVLFTFSRGGFLTLACVVPALIWRQRHRLAVFALVGLVAAGVLWFTSAAFTEAYTERASSISDYEEDGSALGRLNAWTTSWRVFLDYPAFGVGPNNLQIVHPRYSPDPNRFRVSHNAYLQVLAECGLPALVLFVAVIVSGLVALGRLRRATDLPWVETYARMMQISILAYVVGSMFLNTAYSELIYQLVAMSVSLELAARAASAAGSEVDSEATPALATAAEPWWRRPPVAIGGVQTGRA